VVGYQQLDAYGDWQNDPTYGSVWYPRNVDADWAPYRDGQWVDVAPWGWTLIDAAALGLCARPLRTLGAHRSALGWVPGQRQARPVLRAGAGRLRRRCRRRQPSRSAAAATASAGSPLAPGEPWRPGYRASQRYVDEGHRAAFQRQLAARNGGFANQQLPGAVTVVPPTPSVAARSAGATWSGCRPAS